MKFQLIPILDQMEALYQLPRNRKRFEVYLSMLQGESGTDMLLPIAGYNPMGKALVAEKIVELKTLDAEGIIGQELIPLSQSLANEEGPSVKVVINLADNVEGAWSSLFTTDFTSKFDIEPLVKRNFCTPYFWTGESFSPTLIIQRAREYAYRTVYWIKHGKPATLKDHVDQEVFTYRNSPPTGENLTEEMLSEVDTFFSKHADTEDYSLIFNFFYGDEASSLMAYRPYGMKAQAGFAYACWLSQH